MCRLEAADRQGAAEAFGKALVRSVGLLGSGQTLDDKSGQLVEQLIRVSVGGLFDPDAVILSRLFRNTQIDDRMLGVMMEKVPSVLGDMMHKPIAQRAMEVAMQEQMRLWGDEYAYLDGINLLQIKRAHVARHASLASNELLAMLAPPEAPVTSKNAGKKPAGTGWRGATAKRGAKAGENSSAPLPARKSNVTFERPTGLVQSMDMLAQVLGLLGHTFLKLQFMHLILWICEESDEAETAEAHYLELGQVANATSILARANEIAESNVSQVDISTLVILRLLYPDILARNQQAERSIKTYKDALELSEQIEAVDKHAAYMVKTQARLPVLQRSAIACGVYASIQASRDDTVSMLAGFKQALGLWN
ncbi:hypothetical protein FRC08_013193 [Ceratobasidium sp. 394]|nr:hypothetical protein FRC08_013193 [Ceratobasidium sp. 394]